MYARTYAQVIGVIFLLAGVIGLIMGNPDDGLLGFNVDVTSDILHLATGALLAYAGFSGGDDQARSIMTGIGVFFLLFGILGFSSADPLGLYPNELAVQDDVGGIVLGVVALWAARGGAEAAPRVPRPGAPA